MRAAFSRLLLLAALSSLFAFSAGISRPMLVVCEKAVDKRLEKLIPGEPYLLLGMTQSIYLPGYGLVMTATVNLAEGPGLTPFRPNITPKDKNDLRQKKLDRLPLLREAMRDALVSSATMLDSLPGQEQVVLGVALFTQPWEDTTGLPGQIVMSAPRKALASKEAAADRKQLDGLIQTREF